MVSTLPTISPAAPLLIPLHPLTPTAFSPFGTLITPPISSTLHSIPTSPPPPLHPSHQPQPTLANQSTALKTSPISPLTNAYPTAPTPRPNIAMFSCFPRQIPSSGKFPITILERHPHTTQTFSPLGLDASDTDTAFVVIVAPSLHTSDNTTDDEVVLATTSSSSSATKAKLRNPPDLANIKAFVGRGNQAVTYGVGTWHAPMVVVGKTRVDFVVVQFVNGTEMDCEEVLIGEGISVSMSGLGLEREARAKL